MTDREKLIELIRVGVACPDDGNPFEEERCASCRYRDNVDCDYLRLADYLIANGVTFATENERPPTDLSGKCGSCAFSEPTEAFGGSKCYVLCTNKDIRGRSSKSTLSAVRQRTARACKRYVPKGD